MEQRFTEMEDEQLTVYRTDESQICEEIIGQHHPVPWFAPYGKRCALCGSIMVSRSTKLPEAGGFN